MGNSNNTNNLLLYSGHETADPYISFRGGDALRFIKYDGGLNELMRIQSDGRVGIGTQSPHASAKLEVESSDKGVLIPRMTESEISVIENPAEGLTVYNTDKQRFYFFDGAAKTWRELAISEGIIFPGCGIITDGDGNTYNTVVIGSQCWMAKNLITSKYDDGTDILLVTNEAEWWNLTSPGYCWYNNVTGNTYGALYNWHTVNMGNPCPIGWHVPTFGEWETLDTFLGIYQAGGILKEAGTVHWQSPNTGATNEHGFTALPGGFRFPTAFLDIHLAGKW